jgi:PhnB protein
MSVSTVAHLNFTGDARPALAFYHSVFGGHLMTATYAQVGAPRDSADSDQAVFSAVDPDSPDADHIAFGMVATDDGFRLAAYDVFEGTGGGLTAPDAPEGRPRAAGLTHTEPFFLLLNGETLDELTETWNKLAEGGTVIQALAPAQWAPAYGMLTDRFGVTWIFGLTPAA